MTDLCRERLMTVTKRLMVCDRPAKATVLFRSNPPHRVCGVHARQAERDLENVIWDATYDERGTRV